MHGWKIGFIIFIILIIYLISQIEYFLVKLQSIPDSAYEKYKAHKGKYEKSFDWDYYIKDGYYSLRKCRFNNTNIIEVQGGWRGGGGVFNFFDEEGSNICNFYWSIDNCAQHGCDFKCPKTDNCKVIAGTVDFEKDYVITYKTFE